MTSFAQDRGRPESTPHEGLGALRPVRDQAMFLLDRQGRCATWNEGVQSIFGWNEDDWLGQPAGVVFRPEDVAAGVPQRELRQAAESGGADVDGWRVRRDGRTFRAAGSVTRIAGPDGEVMAFMAVLRDATRLQQAEEECARLLASEQAQRAEADRQSAALTAAIEAMPHGVYIGDASGITRCNRPGLEMLGALSLEDLRQRIDELGRKFRVRRERDGPLVDPEDLPYVRALAGETAVLDTWATQPSTGRDVFIRGTAAPIVVDGRVTGVVAVNSDITASLQVEQQREELARVAVALAERDEQLRAVFAGVRDYSIFTIDLEGRIASWHEGSQRMKGYSVEEAIGMPFARLFTPEERAAGRPLQEMEVAARTGEFKGGGQRLRKNGELFDVEVVLTALHGPHGELLGYLKLTQDVSERKRQERERAELLRNANAARADAERASDAKGEFLATISHELRTPLGAILGWAHVLERGLSDPQGVKHALAAIRRSANVQVQLIEDLLDMSRIEAGQLRLEMQPVELPGVISRAVENVLPTATTKGVALRTLLDPAARVVTGDPDRLQQIVWNLLSNAVKFTPAGGRITVALENAADDAVEISVADTGQGVDAEFLPHVFDRFRQQDATSTRRHGGLGIGLAIVRQLAELHGGSAAVESAGVGKGSIFSVRLPARALARRTEAPFEASLAAAARVDAARRLDGLTVLLVDDEAEGRAIAEHVLRTAGARVLAADNAKEGYALFLEHRPDAILGDIAMPVHDGYDFIRWVRALQSAEGGHTPAAAFTAYARHEDRDRALTAGYTSHLVKPVEPEALVGAVADLVGRTPDAVGAAARAPT